MTLGQSRSGKTNYVETALLYISRYWGEKAKLKGNNRAFLNALNKTERKLQSGNWLDKTMERRELKFQSKESTWASDVLNFLKLPSQFVMQKRSVIVDDWTGEAFSSLSMGDDELAMIGDDEEKKSKEEERLSFKKAISETEYFIICIDGEKLLDEQTISEVQDVFVAFQHELEGCKKKRHFAFAVTKTDLMEGIPQYAAPGGGINIDKLKEIVRKKYLPFFQFIEWEKYPYTVCAVSCVPTKSHRDVDGEKGTVPNNSWDAEDMKEQLTPFEWIWKQFPLSI